jgi:hypothetical protein
MADAVNWEDFGVRPSRLTHLALRIEAVLSGFNGFLRTLPGNLEELLRYRNWRAPAPGPLDSATLVFDDDRATADPFERAASLILAARELKACIESGALSVAGRHGAVIETGQFFNLFGTHLATGSLAPNAIVRSASRAVLVLCRGIATRLTIPSDISNAALAPHLVPCLRRIASATREAAGLRGELGALTSCHPRMQRQLLAECQGQSGAALSLCKATFLTLCLDLDTAPELDADAGRAAQVDNFRNRNYGASVQLVVFGNAKAAMLASWAANLDGNTMMRAGGEICERARPLAASVRDVLLRDGADAGPGGAGGLGIKPLTFGLTQQSLDTACAEAERLQGRQRSVHIVEGCGRRLFEAYGVPVRAGFVVLLHVALRATAGAGVDICVRQHVAQSAWRCMGTQLAAMSSASMLALAGEVLSERVNARVAARELAEALADYRVRIEGARNHLGLEMARGMFKTTLTMRRRKIIGMVRNVLLALAQPRKRPRWSVTISHPEPHPRVTCIGRPGVALAPGQIQLHYDVRGDATQIVVAAAPDVPIDALVDNLRAARLRLIPVLEQRVSDLGRAGVRGASPDHSMRSA